VLCSANTVLVASTGMCVLCSVALCCASLTPL
jgi:hypothetical protein